MNQKEKQNESVLSSISNIKEKRADKSSHFELPPVTGLPPEGFMTGEEFTKRAIEKVRRFCNDNGIL